jgi:hypothetical protein
MFLPANDRCRKHPLVLMFSMLIVCPPVQVQLLSLGGLAGGAADAVTAPAMLRAGPWGAGLLRFCPH